MDTCPTQQAVALAVKEACAIDRECRAEGVASYRIDDLDWTEEQLLNQTWTPDEFHQRVQILPYDDDHCVLFAFKRKNRDYTIPISLEFARQLHQKYIPDKVRFTPKLSPFFMHSLTIHSHTPQNEIAAIFWEGQREKRTYSLLHLVHYWDQIRKIELPSGFSIGPAEWSSVVPKLQKMVVYKLGIYMNEYLAIMRLYEKGVSGREMFRFPDLLQDIMRKYAYSKLFLLVTDLTYTNEHVCFIPLLRQILPSSSAKNIMIGPYFRIITDEKFYVNPIDTVIETFRKTPNIRFMISYCVIHVPSTDDYHATALVFDSKEGQAEFFDPNGYRTDYYDEVLHALRDAIEVPNSPFRVVSFSYPFGIQHLENNQEWESVFIRSGYCQFFTMIFMLWKIADPLQSTKRITETIHALSTDGLALLLRSVSSFIFEKCFIRLPLTVSSHYPTKTMNLAEIKDFRFYKTQGEFYVLEQYPLGEKYGIRQLFQDSIQRGYWPQSPNSSLLSEKTVQLIVGNPVEISVEFRVSIRQDFYHAVDIFRLLRKWIKYHRDQLPAMPKIPNLNFFWKLSKGEWISALDLMNLMFPTDTGFYALHNYFIPKLSSTTKKRKRIEEQPLVLPSHVFKITSSGTSDRKLHHAKIVKQILDNE